MNDRDKEIAEHRAKREREAQEASERLEQKLRDGEAARGARSSELERRLTPEDLAKLDRPAHAQVIEYLRSRTEHPDVAAERERVRSRAEAERLIERAVNAVTDCLRVEPKYQRAHQALLDAFDVDDEDALQRASLSFDVVHATSMRLLDESIAHMQRVRELPREMREAHEELQGLLAA